MRSTLQSLLGLDLGEIRDILVGEDALDGLRPEYRAGPEAVRRKEILHEASAVNEKLRAVVSGRQEVLPPCCGRWRKRRSATASC